MELREFILSEAAADKNLLIYRSILKSVDSDEFCKNSTAGWVDK